MTLRSGVILGCGAIAREHIFAMQLSGKVDVAAVCDLSAARAESIAERFKIAKWFTSHRDMLRDVKADFVHITTPPQSHFALAKDCLDAGFNVICEKPITPTFDEFVALRDLAAARGLLLIENQNYRTHSSIRRLMELYNQGVLGELVDIYITVQMNIHAKGGAYNDPNLPHFSASMRGGVAGDFLTHMSYIAQLFAGELAPSEVFWRKFKDNSELGLDEFRALVKGRKSLVHLSFSGNTQPAGFWLRLNGTEAVAEANLFDAPRIVVRRPRGGGPLATFKDALSEARDIRRSAYGSLYRKFSGEARYDGLMEYLDQCYAALDSDQALPVQISEMENTSRLIDHFCSTWIKS